MFYQNNLNDADYNCDDWVQYLKNDTEPRIIFTNSLISPEQIIQMLGEERCFLVGRFVISEFVNELPGRQGFRNSFLVCPPTFEFDHEMVKESALMEALRLNLIFLYQRGGQMTLTNKFLSLVRCFEPEFKKIIQKEEAEELIERVWREHPTYNLFANPLQLINF